MEETKQQKFVRIAEPRVTRACKAVSLLGNLASSNYEYHQGAGGRDVRRSAAGTGHGAGCVQQTG